MAVAEACRDGLIRSFPVSDYSGGLLRRPSHGGRRRPGAMYVLNTVKHECAPVSREQPLQAWIKVNIGFTLLHWSNSH